MAATYDSIVAKLVTLVSGLTGMGTVEDYATVEYATYPGASIYQSDTENEILDSDNNLIGRRFTIRIIDEIKTNPKASEARMRDLTEQCIIALLRSDDLDGEVEILKPAVGKAGFAKGDLGEYRIVNIDVVCQSSVVL